MLLLAPPQLIQPRLLSNLRHVRLYALMDKLIHFLISIVTFFPFLCTSSDLVIKAVYLYMYKLVWKIVPQLL